MDHTMNTIIPFLLAFLLTTASLSLATRPHPSGSSEAKPNTSKGKPIHHHHHHHNHHQDDGNNGGAAGFFGPGAGFNIPGFGNGGWGSGNVGGGYGSGYGGPSGGHSQGGVIKPTGAVVCKEKGPCYNKKLTCPAKCFSSYSRSGKGYGGGGGGGGCTMDCRNKCVAYC